LNYPSFIFGSLLNIKSGFIWNGRGVKKKGFVTFSDGFLRGLGRCDNFKWHWLQPRGKSGGILAGICLDRFDTTDFSNGKYFLRAVVLDKKMNFTWVLVIVYGALQEEDK
jgi:hypothetical protein